MSCAQVQEYDKIVIAKDNEIKELQSQLSYASGSSFPEVQDALITLEETRSLGKLTREPRRGRPPPPPIDTFLEKTRVSDLMTGFQP